MNDILSVFQAAFNLLDTPIYGIPIIVYVVIACIFGLITKFIMGKK